MAIGDILEGLLAGAAGGFRGYSEMSRLRREEEERERVRREAAAERREQREYERQRDEQQDALAAALRDVQMAEMGYRVAPEMAATGATFAPEAPELMSVLEDLRPTAADIPAPARPETRDGRIRGTDVGVAPGQTYSAVQKALMDAERERPEPQPDTRMVMERGPRPIEARLPSAEERGAQVLRFPGDRTYVRERQLTPAEQREVDLGGDAADVVAAGRAMGLNLTTEQGRAVASGKVRFADLIPEAPKTTDPTSLQQNLRFLMDQGYSLEDALNRLEPPPAGRAGSVEGLSPTDIRTIYNQAQRRLANEIEARAAMEFDKDAPSQYTPEEARDRLREIIEEETETFLGIGVPREPELPPAPAAPPAPGAFLDLARGNFMQRSLLGEQASAIDEEQRQAGLAYLERFQQEQRDERNRLRR